MIDMVSFVYYMQKAIVLPIHIETSLLSCSRRHAPNPLSSLPIQCSRGDLSCVSLSRYGLVEGLNHGVLVRGVDVAGTVALA